MMIPILSSLLGRDSRQEPHPREKRVLVILGHPVSASYCGALAESYAAGVREAGGQVELLRLGELDFAPSSAQLYNDRHALPPEPELRAAMAAIQAADHLVFVYPTWWGGMPALLKGFIDRVFLPGFAYRFRAGKALPEELLKGKSARLITTMDAPLWWYQLVQGNPGHKMLRHAILYFCGVRPVRATSIGTLRTADADRRDRYLGQVRRLGHRMA